MKETINIEINDMSEMRVDIKATAISLGIVIIALAKKYYEVTDDQERFALSHTLLDVLKGR